MTKQIGRHIRCIECAQHTVEQNNLDISNDLNEGMVVQDSDVHHHISKSQNDPLNIYSYVHANQGDPVLMIRCMLRVWVLCSNLWVNLCRHQQFIPKLKDHILERLLDREYEGDTYSAFTDEERNTVIIAGEEIFHCKTLRINYTTYNVRWDSDTIKPNTYPDVMVKSPETGLHAQPYWYMHVIGIFHAVVLSSHPGVKTKSCSRMEFLWVRWFGVEPGQYHHGFHLARLPKIGFVESSDDYTFTFLDPGQVIRGAHITPAFFKGHISALLPAMKSQAWVLSPDKTDDWVSFYVNMWVWSWE